MSVSLAETALLIVDLQNDFLHPEGAYGRAGQGSDAIAALPERIAPVAAALRAAGGSVVSTQFTLVPGRHDEPLIAPHLKSLRPFLGKGDFAPGSWGHSLVDTLAPADFIVEKVAYSAFYMSRLELVLRRAGLKRLIVCGIVTNGGVAATLRGAHVRDFETILLSDGCGAFRPEVHDVTIASLSTVSPLMTCDEALAQIGAAAVAPSV
ncbi:cysteine hydrolase [Rhodobacteraceae bacterium D3-12]|nr:cysteine hydrolase [Rhodobacteraceae bacterium D3-12]